MLQRNSIAVVFTRLARTLALLLLAWQAVIAQAHQHAPAYRAGPAAAAQVVAQHAPGEQRPDGALDCPVCRTLAHADAYVAPGPLSFVPPATTDQWSPVALLTVQFHDRRSHAWRSRAPPIRLPS